MTKLGLHCCAETPWPTQLGEENVYMSYISKCFCKVWKGTQSWGRNRFRGYVKLLITGLLTIPQPGSYKPRTTSWGMELSIKCQTLHYQSLIKKLPYWVPTTWSFGGIFFSQFFPLQWLWVVSSWHKTSHPTC